MRKQDLLFAKKYKYLVFSFFNFVTTPLNNLAMANTLVTFHFFGHLLLKNNPVICQSFLYWNLIIFISSNNLWEFFMSKFPVSVIPILRLESAFIPTIRNARTKNWVRSIINNIIVLFILTLIPSLNS